MFTRSGRLALYFLNQYNQAVGRASTLAATLDALALEPMRLSDVARAIGSSAASTSHYLDRLGDLVERREGGLYALSDPLVGHWLRWRRPGGAPVPMSVVGDAAELAVAKHLSELGFDLVYQPRASRGAFDLLAIRGSDQLGVQVKKSPLPVYFPKREWNRMAADANGWGWAWIVAVLTDDEQVLLLDPMHATVGRRWKLDSTASIDNLLQWVDDIPTPK